MNSQPCYLRQARLATVAFVVILAGCAGPGGRGPQRAAYSAYIRGLMLERTAKLPLARDAYQMALEFDEKSPRLHARLGATYVKLGQPEKALSIYTELLRLHPDNADLWHLLGVAVHQKGNAGLAADLIETAISLNGGAADYQRWPSVFFAEHGLFFMTTAHAEACQSAPR